MTANARSEPRSLSEVLASTEFQTAVQSRHLEATAARLGDLAGDPVALRMLALVPFWTPRLLQGTGLDPVALTQRGILDDLGPEGADEDYRRYRIERSLRDQLMHEWTVTQAGVAALLAAAGDIAPRLLAAPSPEAIRRWAVLAQHVHAPGQMAKALDAEIEATIRAGGGIDGVLAWIETARPLADLLNEHARGEMEIALRRAGRRLELLRRDERDERALTDYLSRQELDLAVERLLRLPDDAPTWALHFIGAGGTGKTTFLRHLATRLAKRLDAVVARIDFDHLSPDFPTRAPGLLLWAFAQELQAHDRTLAATSYLQSADSALAKLHDRIAVEGAVDLSRDPDFGSGIRAFASAVRELSKQDGQSRPVVLVLDTCEELAKHLEGGVPAALNATFDILELLKAGDGTRLAPLRVIFAGRRLLASAGANYNTGRSTLGARPWLELTEVRGFTAEEARAYLAARAIPAPYVDAILDAAPEPGGGSTWQVALRADQAATGRRYSPFELRHFVEWVRDVSPPSVDDVRRAKHARYVELRILSRLRDPELERLLPVLTRLGAFDRDTLAAVCDPASVDPLFARIREQEWIDSRTAILDGGRAVVDILAIQPLILERFEEYYAGRALDSERPTRLADALEARTTVADTVGRIDPAIYAAAFRILAPVSDRAVRWWLAVESLVLRERDHAWCSTFLEQVLAALAEAAVEGRASRALTLARPLLQATRGAARAAIDEPRVLNGLWADVARDAARLQLLDVALRAAAGMVDASVRMNRLSYDALARLDAAFDRVSQPCPTTLYALVQAASALADWTDPRRALGARAAETIRRIVGAVRRSDLDGAAHAYGGVLVARTRTEHDADSLLSIIAPASTGDEPRRPHGAFRTVSLRARSLLEAALAARQAGAPLSQVARAVREAQAKLTTAGIDEDRVMALVFQLALAEGQAALERATALCKQGVAEPPALPSTNGAHLELPPAAVVASEVLLAAGDVEDALDLTERLSASANALQARAAARACARALYRMHLVEEGYKIPSTLRESPLIEEVALVAIIEGSHDLRSGLPHPPPDVPRSRLAAWLHAIWRSVRFEPSRAAEVRAWVNANSFPKSPNSREDADSVLDGVEIARLLAPRGEPAAERPALGGPEDWAADPAGWLAVALRRAVLFGDHLITGPTSGPTGGPFSGPIARLRQLIGLRRAAEVAMEEGDALALRLPDLAAPLFDLAASWFMEAGDPIGALRSRIQLCLADPERADDKLLGAAWTAAAACTELPAWSLVCSFAAGVIAGKGPPVRRVFGPWFKRAVAVVQRRTAGRHGPEVYRPEASRLLPDGDTPRLPNDPLSSSPQLVAKGFELPVRSIRGSSPRSPCAVHAAAYTSGVRCSRRSPVPWHRGPRP